MQPRLPAHRTLLEPGAKQDDRRVDCPAGDHHYARLDAGGASRRLLRAWSEECAHDASRAPSLPLDLFHPAVRVDVGAGRHGIGQIRQRCRLLRVHGTAHAAISRAQALPHIATRGVDLPSQLVAAVVDGAVVRIGVLRIDLLDPEPALHLLEVRAKHLRSEREPLAAAPVLENVIGRAVARRPVHDGTAANRAPLQHLDGEVGRRPVAAVLVEARVCRRLLHVEVRLGVVAAFLEDHHLRAGARETGRDHRAARTAPDDADVGLQHHVLVAVRPDHWRAPGTDFTSSYGGPGYPTLA